MKRFILFLLPLALLFACTKSKEPASIPEEAPEEIIFDENQIYSDSSYGRKSVPYDGTCNVVGTPSTLAPGGIIPSSTYTPPDLPWVIEGKVTKGVIEIVFPQEIDSLDSMYGSRFTEGIKVAQVYLWNKEASCFVFALHKWSNNVFGRILIYYSEEAFSKFNNGTIELKRGWNFLETIYENHHQKIGRIEQDIADFMKDGYRWEIELWAGTGPDS